ncbi:porin [Salinimonas marina]|uniref:Porin n=1 Tax=Salinimonas marina TaxID=2785918 RepID=A0A7S9DY86_9ALTE|nr:DcaP family trimeric outer membrane transporter [Salinimonas marina]QPG06045.1 porin [Salinimonas marina]
MKHTVKKTAVLCALFSAGFSASAQNIADTQFKFSGYIKADAIVTDYSDGSLPSGSVGRDFYIPSLTPVDGNDEGTQLDAHIRQSRFRITTNSPTSQGDSIKGVLELDFIVTGGGDERVSNSYTPRIRHAFLEYQDWLIGQTWSTFMDVSILPESLDFVGAADGVIFNRQTMVRYSKGGFQVALENPEATIATDNIGSRETADDNVVPDLIGAYKVRKDWGHIKVAGMLRQLSYDNGMDVDEDEIGYGMAVSGKLNFVNGDDLRMSFNAGSGMGRYMAVNAATGVAVNPQKNNQLEAIDSYGYSIAYRHLWSDKARSSVIFAALEVDNPVALTGPQATKSTYSTRINYLYSPVSALTFGAEYAFAKREVESGLEGDMNRVQFSAKYAF